MKGQVITSIVLLTASSLGMAVIVDQWELTYDRHVEIFSPQAYFDADDSRMSSQEKMKHDHEVVAEERGRSEEEFDFTYTYDDIY